MIYFRIKDENNKIVAGNMEQFSRVHEFENNKEFSEIKNGLGIKGAYDKIDDFSIWIVVENEKDLIKSNKLFKKTFQLYKKVSLDVYKHHKNEIGAYAHMLNTIQAQIRQKIDDFADNKEFIAESYADSMQKILSIIEDKKESTADLICYIQKRIIDMRAQLLGAEVIHSGEQYEIKQIEVSLKRAILHQCTPFLDELNKKHVRIKFYFDDECKTVIDKNMFSLVMYNFFSNASKYTRPDSEIRLHYSGQDKNLDISMISLKMEKSELTNIHKDGVRGNHAVTIPGKGIGLFVISRALNLMSKSHMYISPNYEKCSTLGDLKYVENHFRFTL